MAVNGNIHERKIELIQWVSALDNVAVLDEIDDLREQQTRDWWDQISEEEKLSIERGIVDADGGKMTPHSEVRAIYEKWL